MVVLAVQIITQGPLYLDLLVSKRLLCWPLECQKKMVPVSNLNHAQVEVLLMQCPCHTTKHSKQVALQKIARIDGLQLARCLVMLAESLVTLYMKNDYMVIQG